MKNISILIFSIILLGIANYSYADYPIMSHSYLADPGAIVHEGRVYVYCSNDNENPEDGTTYDMSSIVCVSSTDLKNWTDHGIVFDVPRDASWTSLSWAPSPAYRDGKFYLYYGNGGSAIGVAVADNPLGPFTDPIGRALVNSSTPGVQPFDGWLFDPMTFIDDDGQAYMYFGGNGDHNLRVIKLNDDMISIDGDAESFNVPNFFEAAWLHKYDGTYYFTYSTTPAAGMRIDYMTSSDPMTGFTYGGIMSPQPPVNNNNNHQAVIEIDGEWYQVYHNRIVARDNIGESGMPYHRNLAIDKFYHNADGSITQMINTVDGLEQLHYLDPFIRQEGETFSNQSGINTEVCSEGGMNLAFIDNNDWIMVEGVDFGTAGASSFLARVASDKTGGTIEIRLGSTTGTLAGTMQVPNTGGFQTWQTESISINKITGVHNVYFVFKGSGASLFNINYWTFFSSGPIVTITSPTASDIIFEGDEITISATATPQEGTIESVEFFVNGQSIGSDNTAPYSIDYTFTESGQQTISIIATDSNGDEGNDSYIVNVNIPQAPYNGTPHPIPGKIEFEHYDVGGNGFAYFDTSTGNTGGADYRMDEDVDLEDCTDDGGGYNLGWTVAEEWLEYTVNVASTGLYNFTFRVACNGTGRTISLTSNGNSLIDNIEIPDTEDWQVWTDVIIQDVELTAGEQVLRLTIGDTDYVNLNYMTISQQPSITTPFQLISGWNFIGCPLEGTTNIENALSSIWDNVESVKNMDSYFDKNQAEFLNSLTQLKWGQGYLVKVNDDCELIW